jgi:hypothetical protein
MNRIPFVAAVSALLLSACGAPAAPTVDPAQVQASAVAAAGTMVAATQAAIPTNTPVPPTPLPSPTALPTLVVVPTLGAFPSPTAPPAGGSEDCNHALDVGASGAQAAVLIRNDTKGPVTFSMGLGSKNSFGQCGYLSWSIPKANSVYVSVPQTRTNQGDPCYWAYAWINDPKHQSTVSGGGYCINNPDKWTFDVGYDRIKLTPP